MRKMFLMMLMSAVLLLGAGLVSAAPYNLSIHTPSSSARPSGVYQFQLNISVDSGANDITNTTFAIDGTIVCRNDTAVVNATGQILISCKYNTLSLAYNDTSTHTLLATIYSNTSYTGAGGDANGTATRTSTWDNTLPTLLTYGVPAANGKVRKSAPTFTGTNYQSGNNTGCTLMLSYDGGNTYGNTYAMTVSGNTCTYTASKGSPPDGSVYWKMRTTDGLNTTDTTARQSIVDFAVSSGAQNVVDSVEVAGDIGADVKQKGNSVKIILLVGILAGVYYFFVRKK